jgi:endothelin-converting enzyme/putative endopeptidase
MQPSVDPCDNFYLYACGGWIRENARHPGRDLAGRGVPDIRDRNRVWLWERIADPERAGRGGPAADLAALYAACMNEADIEQAGIAPLAPLLAAIDAVQDRASLMRVLAMLHQAGVPVLFDFTMDRDPRDPDVLLLEIRPVSPYQFRPDTWVANARQRERLGKRYARHAGHMLEVLGAPSVASDDADAVIALEDRLTAAMPVADPHLVRPDQGSRLTREAFDRLVAPLPFDEYFAAAGMAQPRALRVRSEDYMRVLAEAASGSLAALRAHLRWHLLRTSAPYLSADIREEQGRFERFGVPDDQPRWNFCTQAAEEELPDQVARLYADQLVDPATRQVLAELVNGVQIAAVARAGEASWLEPPARQRAAAKLAAIDIVTGYPGVDGDLSEERSRAGGLLALVFAARARRFERAGAQLDASPPTPPRLESVSPNAFYRPTFNQVLIPWAIVRPPMLHAALPPAINYAALGAVVGHELAHALDDQGRRFDQRGHVVDGWDASATGAFADRFACLKTHYGRHRTAPAADYLGVALPAQEVDADRTANEGFADVSGLLFAYDAYRAGATEDNSSVVQGLSNDQLFFLGYAQAWCTNADALAAQVMAQIDPHVPGGVRVNAALRQIPAFARAFSCGSGMRMRVDRPCAIW